MSKVTVQIGNRTQTVDVSTGVVTHRGYSPYINTEGNWMVFVHDLGGYIDTGISAAAHSPMVSNDEIWLVYDDEAGEYVSTGISCRAIDYEEQTEWFLSEAQARLDTLAIEYGSFLRYDAEDESIVIGLDGENE